MFSSITLSGSFFFHFQFCCCLINLIYYILFLFYCLFVCRKCTNSNAYIQGAVIALEHLIHRKLSDGDIGAVCMLLEKIFEHVLLDDFWSLRVQVMFLPFLETLSRQRVLLLFFFIQDELVMSFFFYLFLRNRFFPLQIPQISIYLHVLVKVPCSKECVLAQGKLFLLWILICFSLSSSISIMSKHGNRCR